MSKKRKSMEDVISTTAKDELDKAIEEKKAELVTDRVKALTPDQTHTGHRQRVKDRFIASGLEGFAPHEVLELLLFYAIPRKDTKQLAHTLIKRFGSLAGVMKADISELTRIDGISENAALLIKLIPETAKKCSAEEAVNVSYTNTRMLAELFAPQFAGCSAEKFLLACFDNNLCVLSIKEISRGTSVSAAINMRLVMEEVIRTGCTMAALSHNHPKGSPNPSDMDISITRRINEHLRAVEVGLMDHIIVGENKTYSMREGGDLGIFD